MKVEKRKLIQIKNSLREKEEHLGVPIKGGEDVIIKGADITDVRVHDNGALIAITKAGQYFLIPTFKTPDELYENSPFPDLLQRVSYTEMVNVTNVADVDYKEHRVTFINGAQMAVEEKYWSEFIKAYEEHLKSLN